MTCPKRTNLKRPRDFFLYAVSKMSYLGPKSTQIKLFKKELSMPLILKSKHYIIPTCLLY